MKRKWKLFSHWYIKKENEWSASYLLLRRLLMRAKNRCQVFTKGAERRTWHGGVIFPGPEFRVKHRKALIMITRGKNSHNKKPTDELWWSNCLPSSDVWSLKHLLWTDFCWSLQNTGLMWSEGYCLSHDRQRRVIWRSQELRLRWKYSLVHARLWGPYIIQ